MIKEELIKSKARVAEFGEVFTPAHIVNDMLDLVKEESYRVDSKFLEPACGNGNFLVKILERKLKTVREESLKLGDSSYMELGTFIAISTIYAIDIQRDNVEESRERMLGVVKETFNGWGIELSDELENSLVNVLGVNIIWGDGLSGLTEPTKQADIIIAEWCLQGEMVTRRDFAFNNLTSELLRDLQVKEHETVDFRYTHNTKVKKKKSRQRESADLMDSL